MNENEKYHADTTRISKSGLDLINKAPRLYHERYLNPARKKPTKTIDAFIFGSAFHLFILEPDKIERELIVAPIFAGMGSKSRREEFKNEHPDKLIITQQQYADLVGMRESVRSHPTASKLLFSGDAEKEFNWIDSYTGVKCKCKVDFINDKMDIVDLKSAKDASDFGFQKSARQHRYHVQDAFYIDGARESGVPIENFYFIAVEKTAPYLVNVFAYDEYERELSRDIYREDLQTYKECKENNIWQGYEPKIKPLTVKY